MRTGRLIRTAVTLIAGVSGVACAARAATQAEMPDGPRAAEDSISVGYGQATRATVSSAISSLGEEELRDTRAARVEELLQGRIPGVQVRRGPNGDFTVRVRGQNTFRGSGEPLFIIDGVPVQAGGVSVTLASIAPQDIARIDVLKDAGATAIYGLQGANGVILIKTRRHRD